MYLRPRDSKGRLIRYFEDGKRFFPGGWREKRELKIKRLLRTRPPASVELDIPPEAWEVANAKQPPVRGDFVRLFWQVHRNHGTESGEIMERFRAHTLAGN